MIAEWLVVALLLVGLLGLLAVTARRVLLERGGGAVECYVRTLAPRRPWRMGFGRYGTDELRWFRIFSLWPWPTVRLSRRGLVIVGRRAPTPADQAGLTPDLVVLEIGWEGADGQVPTEATHEIAMSRSAVTGFLSWLESMPPGADYHRG